MAEASQRQLAAGKKNAEGYRLLLDGDLEGAVAAFTEAIAIDPRLESAYWNRAEAYRRVGRGREAESDSREAERLARIAEYRGRPTRARRVGQETGPRVNAGGRGWGLAALCGYIFLRWWLDD